MEETQEILLQMGFENPKNNVWRSKWFGFFLLAADSTPEQLGQFIHNRSANGESIIILLHSNPIDVNTSSVLTSNSGIINNEGVPEQRAVIPPCI